MHFDPWTLALQAANVLVLVWLLNRFLYRPVKAVIARRQAQAGDLARQAAEAKARAEALQADLDAQRAGLEAERQKLLQAAREAAEAERKTILSQADDAAARTSEKAKAALERARAEAAASLGRDAVRLAAGLAHRLLEDAPRAEVQAAFLDEALAEVRALPAEVRRGVVERASAAKAGCTVTTAEPLSPAAAKRISGKLSAALGSETPCEFKVDPSLIAGAELRFPFTRIRRAWADDLARLEQDLSRDEPAASVA